VGVVNDDDYDDLLERGGDCNTCGQPVAEAHHAYCPSCYREQMGWERPVDRPAGELPIEVIAALSLLRAQLEELVARVDALEQRRTAA
jgi:hypothetical protein